MYTLIGSNIHAEIKTNIYTCLYMNHINKVCHSITMSFLYNKLNLANYINFKI